MKMIAALVALAVMPLAPLANAKQDKSDKKKEPTPPITLSGCVAKSDGTPTQYTLVDEADGTSTYRLSGMNVKSYIGKRVELVGAAPDSKKLQIKTGLLPNAN